MIVQKDDFASLFKKFRLKSGFGTLSEFGEALAKEGLIYEESLFSHWQKGDRIPRDRNLLLTLINIFIKNKAVTTVKESNQLLASVNQRDLDRVELKLFSKNLFKNTPFTVPKELPIFIGRKRHIKEIGRKLLNMESILIYGVAGIGKTALAIKIAHTLKNRFVDGILWYRYDIKGVDSILSNIAKDFGEDITKIKDIQLKSEIVKKMLSRRNVLLILDNLNSYKNINLLLPTKSYRYPILITSKYLDKKIEHLEKIKLLYFNEFELIFLAKKILGTPFVISNLEKIKKLGKLVDYSPLALTLLFKRIEFNPSKLMYFLDHFEKEIRKIFKSSYDNKTLYDSLNISFQELTTDDKNFFISLGVFYGTDFSTAATAYINKIELKDANYKLEVLQKISLLERSTKDRYRIHPLIRIFIENKIKDKKLYRLLTQYYIQFLSRLGRENSRRYSDIELELENICEANKKTYDFGFYEEIIKLWEYLGVFLWDTGRWEEVKKLGKNICHACLIIHDNYSLALCLARELSWLYFWQGDIEKAESAAEKSLAIGLGMKIDLIIALAKQRLGMVYQEQGKLSRAEKFLKEAIELFQGIKLKSYVADTLLYLGHVYTKRKQIDLAKKYYYQSLLRAKRLLDHEAEAIVLYYLGEIYLKQNQLKKADNCFKKALFIDITRKRKAGEGWCSWGLGKIQMKLKNKNEARRLFLKATEVFTMLGMKSQIKVVQESMKNL